MTNKQNVETFEYKAEMKQLLNIIVHSLYTHPEVFLRELISNASDALHKVRLKKLTETKILDADAPLEINVSLDVKNFTFTIEDSGIGMTKDDIVNNIGTVARSGTLEFLNKIKEQNASADDTLIGKFGVGFYSVFMVTDEVTIETRHADNDSQGYRWVSSGEGTYSIEKIDKPTRGTKISFTLKEDAQEFCREYKIKDTITKYSNFVDFPIKLEKEQINTITAIWQRSASEVKDDERDEFYKFLTNDHEKPLDYLQFSMEGDVNFKALLFIPMNGPADMFKIREEKSLHLHTNKVFIQDDCKELLPEYLRFVKGVVDTSDLPLNVSREIVQSSVITAKINKVLTRKLLSFLENLAKKDNDKYKTFYKAHGYLLKSGIQTDFTNRDKIIDLFRFESTMTDEGEYVSLKEYTSRMKESQKEIYYLSGEHKQMLVNNPKLEYFKKHGIEVLLLSDPVDVFVVPSIHEYEKKPIKSIDKSDIELMPEDKIEKPEDNLSKSLIEVFKTKLSEKVENVIISKRLVDSAATLVVGKEGMDPQMEKMMKAMNKDFTGSKKILELNMEHPLLKNLAKKYMANANDPILEKCINQLYEGAMFMDGNLSSSTDFVKRMIEIMEEATS